MTRTPSAPAGCRHTPASPASWPAQRHDRRHRQCAACTQAHALRAAATAVTDCALAGLHLSFHADRITFQVPPEGRTNDELTVLVGVLAALLDGPAPVRCTPGRLDPGQRWIEAEGTLAGHPAGIFALASRGHNSHQH